MGMTTQQNPKALEVGLRQALVGYFTPAAPQIDAVFNVGSTDRNYEEDVTYSDFSAMSEIAEGGGIPYETPAELFTTRYKPRKFGKGLTVTEEMRDDDQNRVVVRQVRCLAKAAAHTLGFSAWNTAANNGFNSSYAGADGKELYATDHVSAVGTYSNEPASPTNLSRVALEDACTDLMNTVDNDGKFVALMPQKLYVSPSLWATAKRLTESPDDPETGNRAINTVNGKFEVYVVPFITNTKFWGIQCDQHEMHWMWRKMLTFGQDGDFNTDDWKYKMKGRWVNGWTDPRGMYASPGV